MLRREFLTGTAALALSGCGVVGGSGGTVGDIVKWLQDNCNFTTTVDMVLRVVTALVAGFNAAAGAAAAVASDVITKAEALICDSVKAQVAASAKLKSAAKGESTQITVPVKVGDKEIEVVGIYIAK